MRPKIALLLCVAGPLAVGPVRAAQLEAVASVEAGVAACSLSSLPLPDGGVGGYNVPSGTTFVGCGFSGDSGLDDQTAASGPLAASWSAGDAQFAGAAQAQADYGPLSAAASGTSTRSGNFTGNAAATQSLASGSADVSFLSGATLIGFEFIDALQQPIGDVVVTAESGTQYVPEPSSELLALASAAAVALLRQRRREATSS